ncbi:MAG: insulinase family protein, partial [Deltaproteobacteria bacterium]|nr:insulinase family protein [Deltaproteobacteria bacterium]
MKLSVFAILTISICLAADTVYSSELTTIRQLISRIQFYQLMNGVKLVFLPQHHSPTFAAVFSVMVGSVDEPKGKKGIAHFLEHLAFKGTKTVGTFNYELEAKLLDEAWKLERKQITGQISADEKKKLKDLRKNLRSLWKTEEFQARLANLGGGSINATTSADFTNYIGKYPAESVNEWISLELDRFLNLVPRQFHEEMRVIFEEREMRVTNNPLGKMYEHFIRLAFPDHPYGYPVIGYVEDLKNLTPQDLLTFHNNHYKGQKVALSIVGHLDNKAIEAMIIPGLLKIEPDGSNETSLDPKTRFDKHLFVRNNFGTKAMLVGY